MQEKESIVIVRGSSWDKSLSSFGKSKMSNGDARGPNSHEYIFFWNIFVHGSVIRLDWVPSVPDDNIHHLGELSVTSESMCTNYWLTACSSLPCQEKVWLGVLTVPP